MSRSYSRAAEGARKKRRRNSILISIAVVVIIVALLAFEQVALLYLIATVSVAALLLIVALSDLHDATPAVAVEPATPDDAAAIADGLTTASAAAVGSPRARAARRGGRRR